MPGTIYLICAVGGGTLFVLQLLLTFAGYDGHGDIGHGDAPGGHDSLIGGLLNLRAIVAAITAFGIGGLLVRSTGASIKFSMPVAIASGVAAMMIVVLFFRAMVKLSDDGTARIDRAVGATGTVYIPIPGDKQGIGKVHLKLQNRTVELEAITYENLLPTGTCVVVTAVVGPSTVEVIAAPEMGTQYVKHEPARTA